MQEPWWKGETGSRSQSCALEKMSKERRMTGHHGSWDGNPGVWGCWVGRHGSGEPRAMPPPQECRKEAWQLGPDLGLCPLSVSLACHSSILSVSAVCHPPFGEAAAEDAFLRALAGDIIHPNPPCACGDKSTRFLSGDAGGQNRQEHCCLSLTRLSQALLSVLKSSGSHLPSPFHQDQILLF